MTRILCVGDIHTKTFLLPFIEDAIERVEPDRILFMGDFMDEWDALGIENYGAALEIIDWARAQGNVTILFGNHDITYLSRSGRTPGFTHDVLTEVNTLFSENLDLLKAADWQDDWLFTHAGLTKSWAQKYLGKPHNAQEAADLINSLLTSKGHLEDLETPGYLRGGYDAPSPLWADWDELTPDYYPGINQIVGHSPHETCVSKTVPGGQQLWCCDTFSTLRSKKPYGDGSMVLLDTKQSRNTTSSLGKGVVTVVAQRDKAAFLEAYRAHFG